MVDTADDTLAMADELRPILLRLARHLRTETHSKITGGQISLLVALEFHPGITPQKIAEREDLSPASISGHLARLEGLKLIRRERTADGRHINLFLTEAGRGRVAAVREERNSWLASRLEQLTADERATIRAALTALRRVTIGDR